MSTKRYKITEAFFKNGDHGKFVTGNWNPSSKKQPQEFIGIDCGRANSAVRIRIRPGGETCIVEVVL